MGETRLTTATKSEIVTDRVGAENEITKVKSSTPNSK